MMHPLCHPAHTMRSSPSLAYIPTSRRGLTPTSSLPPEATILGLSHSGELPYHIVQSLTLNQHLLSREVNHVIPITKYTEAVLSKMVEETITAEAKLTAASNGSIVGINMIPEPFINPFSNAQGGAYPHTAARPVTPSSPTFVYQINPNWTAGESRPLLIS